MAEFRFHHFQGKCSPNKKKLIIAAIPRGVTIEQRRDASGAWSGCLVATSFGATSDEELRASVLEALTHANLWPIILDRAAPMRTHRDGGPPR